MTTIHFTCDLAPDIEGFINSIQKEKRLGTIERHLRQFDSYCTSINHDSGVFDKDVVTGFCQQKNGEPSQEWKQRQSSLRQFSYYLQFQGKYSFVPPSLPKSKEKSPIVYHSSLKKWIESLIEFKQAAGFKYENEKKFLHQFDEFLVYKGYKEDELTREMVDAYSCRPDSESWKTKQNKTSVVRILGIYMVRNGGKAFILNDLPTGNPTVPYFFGEKELVSFYRAVDSYPCRFHWCRYVYPVYFRLLYSTGMRESEGCNIQREDIYFENRRILIRNAKGQKDRFVYISDFDVSMLEKYDHIMDSFFPCRKWLFNGAIDMHDVLKPTSVRYMFRICWERTGLPGSPSTHSFRHTYVIERICQWQKEGRNVDSLIPYLSKQLGHKSIKETYWYCKRLDNRFPEIMSIDSLTDHIIPEAHL
jgi:integrase/recombinase XerD